MIIKVHSVVPCKFRDRELNFIQLIVKNKYKKKEKGIKRFVLMYCNI